MHHKGRNKHHFEYWYDYDMVTKKIVPVDMPDRYIKEMCCDRIAASKVYNKENYTTKSPLNYLQKSTAREKMTETTYRKLLYLLTMLAEKGETAYSAALGTGDWAKDLTQEELTARFHFINVDWNSGER